MAFTVANKLQVNSGGGIKTTYFDFSGSAGDAAGTVTVTGGRVISAYASGHDASGVWQVIPFSEAAGTADGTRTVTFYTHDAITAGGGFIVHQ